MRRICIFAALALLATPGCGDDPVTALFQVPGADEQSEAGFYALPFPNDARIRADGTLDLSEHTHPNALVNLYLDAMEVGFDGFGVASAVFFRFDGELNVDSLPASPEASMEEDAAIYLVNVDPSSPGRGQRIPVVHRFEVFAGEVIGDNWFSVLPFPGFILDEATVYAVVITDRVRGRVGGSIASSSDFDRIASSSVPDDPALAAIQRLYQPLWSWLDEPGGDERSDVVTAAVFTTHAPTQLLAAIRDIVYRDVAAPVARDIVRLVDPNVAWYDGLYDGPNFQRGQVPYSKMEDGGDIAIDPVSGEPVVQRMEELRFSMTIPLGSMPAAGWPVTLYAHGTGGSYHSFRNNSTGRRLASAGIATISIDQVLHPPRNVDLRADLAFFNFENPLSARDSTLQGALDNYQLLRLVQSIDYLDPDDGTVVRFDDSKLFFFGHSQGGVTGVPFVAREPMIKAAVFSGSGGIFYLSLLNKVEPIDIASLVRAIIRDVPLDEFNPVLALLQMFLDRADAGTYGPLLVRRPPVGSMAKNIFMGEGLIDRFTPVPSIEALATSIGVDVAAPTRQTIAGLTLSGHGELALPISNNADGVTAVVAQYDEVPGSDGHFVLFEVSDAIVQSIGFLGSLASTGTATVVVP